MPVSTGSHPNTMVTIAAIAVIDNAVIMVTSRLGTSLDKLRVERSRKVMNRTAASR